MKIYQESKSNGSESRIANKSRCLNCNGDLKQVLEGVWDARFGIGHPFNIWQCKACKLEQIYPLPENEKLSAYYAQHYNFGGERGTLYARIRGLFLGSTFYHLWMAIDGDISFHGEKGDGRLIDVGCNEGRGLGLYRRGGFQVEGLETNPVAAEVARAGGYTVNTGELSLFTPDAPYDVAVLSNVLEHALDPADMLAQVRRILKPGGEVWISCPNGRSWLRSIFGRKWINWHVPFHIVQFTEKTLFQLLEKNGFTIISLHQVTPVLWVAQTIIAALFAKPKKATKQLRNPVLVMVLMLVLRGVGFPFLWLENKLGRGDCLVVKARKV